MTSSCVRSCSSGGSASGAGRRPRVRISSTAIPHRKAAVRFDAARIIAPNAMMFTYAIAAFAARHMSQPAGLSTGRRARARHADDLGHDAAEAERHAGGGEHGDQRHRLLNIGGPPAELRGDLCVSAHVRVLTALDGLEAPIRPGDAAHELGVRCTSPASSVVDRAVSQSHAQAAPRVDPGTGAGATGPADRVALDGVARAQRVERRLGRFGEARREVAEELVERGRKLVGPSPERRRAVAQLGREVVGLERDVDARRRAPPSPPAGAPRRARPRPCGRRRSTSFGHFTCARSPARSATARPARSGSSASNVAQDERHEQRAVRRRDPRCGPGDRAPRSGGPS